MHAVSFRAQTLSVGVAYKVVPVRALRFQDDSVRFCGKVWVTARTPCRGISLSNSESHRRASTVRGLLLRECVSCGIDDFTDPTRRGRHLLPGSRDLPRPRNPCSGLASLKVSTPRSFMPAADAGTARTASRFQSPEFQREHGLRGRSRFCEVRQRPRWSKLMSNTGPMDPQEPVRYARRWVIFHSPVRERSRVCC